MFNSKSPVVKIVGYIIIGFFGLIIIISFGMPDFLSKMGADNTVAAIVNGEKIHVYDYFRYRDRFKNILSGAQKNSNLEDLIFNNFIGEIILLQKSNELGFDVTDERINRKIKEMEEFKNPSTGKYDPERLKLILRQNNLNINDFTKLVRKNLIKEDMLKILRMGIAVTSDDINTEYLINNSAIQIKFAFLSNSDIEKKFEKNIKVTDSEIDEEMNRNLKEIKDPETDKERIRKKIRQQKLEKLTKELIASLNKISSDNGSFTKAASILQGKIKISKRFKIGEIIKESGKEERSFPDLSNSKTFRESVLSLKNEAASEAVLTSSGIYIFTPTFLDVKKDLPSEKAAADIRKDLENKILDNTTNNLMTIISEKAKVIKNLKTD